MNTVQMHSILRRLFGTQNKARNRRQFGPCQGSLAADLLARRRHIRAAAMRHFRRHADALAQRRMRVDGLADVDSAVLVRLRGGGGHVVHVAGLVVHMREHEHGHVFLQGVGQFFGRVDQAQFVGRGTVGVELVNEALGNVEVGGEVAPLRDDDTLVRCGCLLLAQGLRPAP